MLWRQQINKKVLAVIGKKKKRHDACLSWETGRGFGNQGFQDLRANRQPYVLEKSRDTELR